MKLIFLGSPGVGKGTYAAVLKDELNIPHIAASSLLKDEVANGSPLGEEITQIMKSGGLVGDDIMLDLIKNRLAMDDCKKGFILDGYPRNASQAQALKDITDIDYAFNFEADDQIIIDRLSSRIICENCKTIYNKIGMPPKVEGICDKCGSRLTQREDDKPENVKIRLDLYKEKTYPLIEHYEKQGKLVKIVINKNINVIRENLIAKVNQFLSGEIKIIGEIL